MTPIFPSSVKGFYVTMALHAVRINTSEALDASRAALRLMLGWRWGETALGLKMSNIPIATVRTQFFFA